MGRRWKTADETTPLGIAFGKALRTLRRHRGLSQETLAANSELHRTYVGLLERGVHTPSLDAIFRLAKVLGVEPWELVRETQALINSSEPGESD